MQKHSHMLMDKFILLYLFDEEGLIRKLKQTKKTNKQTTKTVFENVILV